MKYRLLRDLPWAKVGEEIVCVHNVSNCIIFRTEEDCKSQPIFSVQFRSDYCDDNPDWFEPVDERWKPGYSSMYWMLNSMGGVEEFKWLGTDYNYSYYNNGNCFQTKDQAEEAAKRIKQTLMDFHKELSK